MTLALFFCLFLAKLYIIKINVSFILFCQKTISLHFYDLAWLLDFDRSSLAPHGILLTKNVPGDASPIILYNINAPVTN